MPHLQLDADHQIPLGTPAFFPALLAHLDDVTYGQGLPIDTVVLQSILLCFISGQKHLILRTSEDDIPLVLRIATTVRSSRGPHLSKQGRRLRQRTVLIEDV